MSQNANHLTYLTEVGNIICLLQYFYWQEHIIKWNRILVLSDLFKKKNYFMYTQLICKVSCLKDPISSHLP